MHIYIHIAIDDIIIKCVFDELCEYPALKDTEITDYFSVAIIYFDVYIIHIDISNPRESFLIVLYFSCKTYIDVIARERFPIWRSSPVSKCWNIPPSVIDSRVTRKQFKHCSCLWPLSCILLSLVYFGIYRYIYTAYIIYI